MLAFFLFLPQSPGAGIRCNKARRR